jgi:CheY-like chemotaxis protein
MLAVSSADAVRQSPLALVVIDDLTLQARACRVLHARGYETVAVASTAVVRPLLARLAPDVVLLDTQRDAVAIAKLLVELANERDAPAAVLLTDDVAWLGARFGLLSLRLPSDAELARGVDRSVRERLRPLPPR